MRFLDLKREIKRRHLIRVNENKHEGITEPTGYVKVYSVCKKKIPYNSDIYKCQKNTSYLFPNNLVMKSHY